MASQYQRGRHSLPRSRGHPMGKCGRISTWAKSADAKSQGNRFSIPGRDKWPHLLCLLDRVPRSSDSKDAPMHLEPIVCFARRINVAPFAPWTWRLHPRQGVGSPRTESGTVDVRELQCLHYGESCGRCPRIATFDKRAGRLCLVWVAPAT